MLWTAAVVISAIPGMAEPSNRFQLITLTGQASLTAAGRSCSPQFSADGRFLFFLSNAGNLVTNNVQRTALDLFVHDLATGENRLVTVNRKGDGGSDQSILYYAVSGNGQRVVLLTYATNLTAPPGNHYTEKVILCDLAEQKIIPISIAPDNDWLPKSSKSYIPVTTLPAISRDGARVLFHTMAQGLENRSSNSVYYATNYDKQNFIYVQDLISNQIYLASQSVDTNGLTNAFSFSPSMSRDGRWVAFVGCLENYGLNKPLKREIFVRDLWENTTTCISTQIAKVWPQIAEEGVRFHSYNPLITPDGRYVVFLTACYSGSFAREIWWYDRLTDTIALISTNQPSPYLLSDQLHVLPLVSDDGQVVLHGDGLHLWVWEAKTQTSRLVDVAWDGSGPGNGEAKNPALSADGSRVAFVSNSTNLVPETAALVSGSYQIYVRDWVHDLTFLITTNATGELRGDYLSAWPVLSPNGRQVAFTSTDDSLIVGDYNHEMDLFLKDLESGELRLISRARPELSSATPLTTTYGPGVSFSQNGRYAALVASDGQLTPGDTNGFYDVVVLDVETGERRLASAGADGTPANYDATDPELSADGHWILFVSRSANLLAGPHVPRQLARNSSSHVTNYVYLRNLTNGTTVLVATNIWHNFPVQPRLSPDGRYVVYVSTATNLVAGVDFPEGATNQQIYLYDGQSASNRLVTRQTNNTPAAGYSWGARFSPDGKWLLFLSTDQDLDPSQTATQRFALYLYNINEQSVRLIRSDQEESPMDQAVFSPDSRWVVLSGSPDYDGYFVAKPLLYDIAQATNYLWSNYAVYFPAFNPNSDKLAYISYDPSANRLKSLRLISLTTGTSQTLLDLNTYYVPRSYFPRNIGFAGNDRFLIFQSYQKWVDIAAEDRPNTYAFDLVTSNITLLTLPSTTAPSSLPAILSPRVLNHGQWLAFFSTAAWPRENDLNRALDLYLYRFFDENNQPWQPLPAWVPEQSQHVWAGTTAFFEAFSTTTAPLAFQWFKDGISLEENERITGVSTSRLVLAQVHASDAGFYSVQVSGREQSVMLPAGRLEVRFPPWLNPIRGLALREGQAGRQLSLAITVDPGLRYQLLSKPDLRDGPWLPEGEPITPTGSNLNFLLDIATNQQRYFRVLLLP